MKMVVGVILWSRGAPTLLTASFITPRHCCRSVASSDAADTIQAHQAQRQQPVLSASWTLTQTTSDNGLAQRQLLAVAEDCPPPPGSTVAAVQNRFEKVEREDASLFPLQPPTGKDPGSVVIIRVPRTAPESAMRAKAHLRKREARVFQGSVDKQSFAWGEIVESRFQVPTPNGKENAPVEEAGERSWQT